LSSNPSTIKKKRKGIKRRKEKKKKEVGQHQNVG
jgi:hypothetical protein